MNTKYSVGDLIAHKTNIDDVYLIIERYWFESNEDSAFQSQWMYRLLRLNDGDQYRYPETTIIQYSIRIA